MIAGASEVLFEAALRALIVALALWIGMRMLRVGNALAQKVAWTMVLAAAITMPFVVRWQWHPSWAAVQLPAAAWSKLAAFVRPSQKIAAASPPAIAHEIDATQEVAPEVEARFSAFDQSARDATVAIDVAPGTANQSRVTSAPAANPLHPRISRAMLISAGWLVYFGVSGLLLLRLMLGLATSIQLWMQATPVARRARFDIPDSIPVRASSRISSPVNIGLGILLPADYVDWDDEKLRVVLAHERSHVHQHDFSLQLLAGLYASVIWFSPLGWWLKRKLSELGETISDHAGLEAAASPSAYAELLLEFAALPRPTVAGVAMAHSTNLHQRIERLLNESSFRRAFAGGRRALVSLLIPAALIVTIALVRVEAAPTEGKTLAQDGALTASAAPAQAPITGQSHPDTDQVTGTAPSQASSASTSQAPQAVPAPAQAPVPAPSPSAAPAPRALPAPAAPDSGSEPAVIVVTPRIAPLGRIHMAPLAPIAPEAPMVAVAPHLYQLRGADGRLLIRDFSEEDYALVGDPGTKTRFYGRWDDDERAVVDKARSVAHGHFLLFRRDGKYYVIDDQEIVRQLEDMQNATNDLSERMRELGKQMRDETQQEREAARKAREANTKITAPDLTKEMAELNAAVANLKASQDGTVSREQLGEIQRKLGEVQRRLISVEVRVDVSTSVAMSKLGDEEGKFGEQMGKLGAEIGQKSMENQTKVRSFIDESLKNGKARPVN